MNTPKKVMRGVSTARAIISAFLQAEMPALIDEARIQWALEDWQLPYPLVWNSYDPLQVQEYPAVGALVSRTNNWRRNDIDAYAEEVYEANYSVRVFIWCLTPNNAGNWEVPPYDSALRCRDDLMGIMRTAFLRTPSMGLKGVVKLNEGTLTEDYLDAIKIADQNNRWAAGGTLSFDMSIVESNYLVEIGTADTVTPTVVLMDS